MPPHTSLTHKTLTRVLSICPADVLALLQQHPGQLFLAGGFLRSVVDGSEPNDIDLFVSDADEAKAFALALQDGKAIVETANAYTVQRTPAVQIIHRWTVESPKQLLASFDFTIGKAILWHNGSGWRSLCSAYFYPDAESHTLRYAEDIPDANPGSSLLRLLKFTRRGYHIPLEDLSRLVRDVYDHAGRSAEHRGSEQPVDMAARILDTLEEIDPPAPIETQVFSAATAGGDLDLPF